MSRCRATAIACAGCAWILAAGCGNGGTGTVHDADGMAEDGAPDPDAPGGDAPRPDDVARPGDAPRDSQVPGTTTSFHVRVIDARTRDPIGAVVSLWQQPGNDWLKFGTRVDPGTPSMGATLKEVGVGGALAHWHGLALWRGEAIIPVGVDLGIRGDGARMIPFGVYRVIVHKGLEFDITEATVDLSRGLGDVFIQIPLSRAIDTTGYFAADMHVHTAPGSGDSTISTQDRIKTMVTAGVEVVVSSDHDYNTDLGQAIRELWSQPAEPAPIAAVAGNEATGYGAHFNVIPAVLDKTKERNGAPPRPTVAMHSQQLMDFLHALPAGPIVQLNHTRLNPDIAYFNNAICGPWLNRAQLPVCSLDFEAMEVLSGYLSCGVQIREQVEDWYALLRFGVVTTATGNSDTHGSSNLIGGFPRSYVRAVQDSVPLFSQDEFMRSLRGRRTVATTAPFLMLRINNDSEEGALVTETSGRVRAKIRMQAASWVTVDEVRLLVNGKTIKTWPVPRVGDATPLLEVAAETIDVAADAFITVEASGKKALPPYVVGEWTATAKDGAGNYICPPTPGAEGGMAVFAITNPVFIDADGDGRYRGPTQPAVFPLPTR